VPKHNIPADRLALYEKLIATNPKIKRKGAANPYTSLNGLMFSYLDPSGSLALRLPEDEREKFLIFGPRVFASEKLASCSAEGVAAFIR
jgi:hypothetical protein